MRERRNRSTIGALGLEALLAILIPIILSTILALPAGAQASSIRDNSSDKVVLYLFWGNGCPHCAEEKSFLKEMQQKYPLLEVRMFEVWYSEENMSLFRQMAEQYKTSVQGVPTTFLGDKYWVGYAPSYGTEMERWIKYYTEEKTLKNPTQQLCIHLFIKSNCSKCSEIIPFLESMKDKYGITIMIHDVSTEEDANLYSKLKQIYSIPEAGFPIVFLGDKYFVGEFSIRNNLEDSIRYCLSHDCVCPVDKISAITPYPPRPGEMTPENGTTLNLPVIGTVDASKMSLPFFTIIIAGLDSFNPCAFFVLFFLLSMLIYAKNRKRMLLIGLTFIFFSGLIYFLFMAAWLNLFLIVGGLKIITTIAGIVAIVIASINIKDFFIFKKGVSLTISDEAKPKLFERMRNLLKASSLTSMLVGTVVLAIASNSYELLCTAGFPMVFTRMLTLHNIPNSEYYTYLLLYNIVYVIPLLVIVLFFTLTLGARKLTEWEGRVLKLTSGLMMLMLGLALLIRPALLNNALSAFGMLCLALLIDTIIIIVTKALMKVKSSDSEEADSQQDNAHQDDNPELEKDMASKDGQNGHPNRPKGMHHRR